MSEITAVPLRPVGKSGLTALWIGVAVLLAAGIGGAYASSQDAALSKLPAEQFMAANAHRTGVKTTASGLEYKVIKPGSGPTPTQADVVQIDYVGQLTNGTPFDSHKLAAFPVAGVVPGFSEALTLMPKGAVYRVWIPPQLGYGDRNDGGPIPPHSVLVFDVTMHDFMTMPAGAPAGMSAPGQ